MSFKTRIILYALLPLVFITGAVIILTSYQIDILSNKETESFKNKLLTIKKREVSNYINLAKAAISPILTNSDIDELTAKKQIIQILNNLKYGNNDGYFFVYNQSGINLVHPALNNLVGKNLFDYKNSNGELVIQSLLKLANAGGGFYTYQWNKPSTGAEREKTSFVIKLDRWGWVLGTGFYLEDVLKEITTIEKKVKTNLRNTFYLILVITIFVTILLGFIINWRESLMANVRLRELASKYVQLQVKERRNYARELHDNVGQLMVAAKYDIELAIHKVNNKFDFLNYAEQAKKNINEAIHDIRHISHSLRPSLLDNMGLYDAMENLLNQFEKRLKIPITSQFETKSLNLSEDIEITVYRIAQEALTNIEKHAGAKNILIKLFSKNKSIFLEISDDGRGFYLEKRDTKMGIGLQNMRERVELLGGIFDIRSSNTNGTVISVELFE